MIEPPRPRERHARGSFLCVWQTAVQGERPTSNVMSTRSCEQAAKDPLKTPSINSTGCWRTAVQRSVRQRLYVAYDHADTEDGWRRHHTQTRSAYGVFRAACSREHRSYGTQIKPMNAGMSLSAAARRVDGVALLAERKTVTACRQAPALVGCASIQDGLLASLQLGLGVGFALLNDALDGLDARCVVLITLAERGIDLKLALCQTVRGRSFALESIRSRSLFARARLRLARRI